jgi:hypothetical protein
MPYIYLIHCRASLNAKENVYKIGKTTDFSKRVNGYDKGSIPIFFIYVNDCDSFERILIDLFCINFTSRNDYGNEYFEGEPSSMINMIIENYNNTPCLAYTGNGNPESNVASSSQINTNDIIRYSIKLKNKLNKINLTMSNMFMNQLQINYQDFMSSQYYHILLNGIQQFNYTNSFPSNQPNRPIKKLGDFMETNYAFINDFINDCFISRNSGSLKIYERINSICL